MADGSIIIDTKIDATGLDKQLSNLKSSISNTTDSLNNLTSKALVGFAALGAAVAPAIKLASDLNESANAAKVVFGDATQAIEEFGKTAQEQAGLTSAEFNQMAAQIGAGLINAGQSQKEAAKQSIELTKRAADMASIFNTDVSEALTAIQAGLRGESEPLRRFAVGLDEASVAAKAVEMGLAKSASTVDAYGKSQARLALIMQQSSKFAGDFVNTSDQLANSTRITTAMIKEEAAQAGARLLPIVLDVVKGFLDWAKEGDRLAKIMQGVADAIKWAVDSGFAQGVLAAAAALGVATLAMKAFVAASTITPGSAVIVGLALLVGAIAGIGAAIDGAIKKQEDLRKIMAGTSNMALAQQNELLEVEKASYNERIAGLQKAAAQFVKLGQTGSYAYKNIQEELQIFYDKQAKLSAKQQENNKKMAEAVKVEASPAAATPTSAGGSLKDLKAILDAEQKLREMAAENEKAIHEKAGKEALRAALEEKAAIEAAMGEPPAVDYDARIAEIKRTDKIMLEMMKDDGKKAARTWQEIGAGVVKRLASGMRQAWGVARDATRKTTEMIGKAFQIGLSAVSNVFSGFGTIIEGIANFDPGKIYEDLKKLVDGIKDFFETDIGATPVFFDAGVKLIEDMIDGLADKKDVIFKTIENALKSIAKTIETKGPDIVKTAIDLVAGIVTAIMNALPSLVSAGLNMIIALNSGLLAQAPTITATVASTLGGILQAIATALPSILKGMTDIALTMTKGLTDAAPTIIAAVFDILTALINNIGDTAKDFSEAGIKLVIAMALGIVANIPKLVDAFINNLPKILEAIIASLPLIVDGVVRVLVELFQQGFNFVQMAKLGVAIIEGIAKGIAGAIDNLISTTKAGFERFVQSVKDFFGIKSPSKLFAEFGGYMAEGIGVGINHEGKGLFSSVSGTFEEFNRQAANALVLDPTMKLSADAMNSVMSGLSSNANLALNVAGAASANALTKQAIQISPAPVIMDGRQVAEVTFRYTDQLVGAAFGA